MEVILLYAVISALIITLIHTMMEDYPDRPLFWFRCFLDSAFAGMKLDLLLYACQYCMTWLWGTVLFLFYPGSFEFNLPYFGMYLCVLAGLNIIISKIKAMA
jgi:signal transduction histidine kinase